MNALDAYGEKDKLYVKVNSPTKYVYLIKFKEKGYPKDDVFVGHSDTLSSIQRVNYVRVYEGEIREINGIEKVGYNEVEIRNFRGIEYPHFYRVAAESLYTSPHLSATSLIHVGVRAPQIAGLPLSGNPA